MNKIFLTLLLIMMATGISLAQKYVFYLHGAIVEGQGDGVVSPYFGKYQYEDILQAFRKAGFTVKSEVRKANTDIPSYAKNIAKQIEELLQQGTPPKNITVIGASKGALIAMHVSTFLHNSDINFVFLAACNDGNFDSFPAISFYGNILSIYEKSDNIGESCIRFKNKSQAGIKNYKEIAINTGLQHGFLFKPLPEWVDPAIAWANGNYQ